MLKETVNTIDSGRKVQALEWEIERHKELEITVAEVCEFLRSVMGTPPDGTDGDIKLEIGARRGFDFILSQIESLLYQAGWRGKPTFYDVSSQSCSYGSEIENPYTVANA